MRGDDFVSASRYVVFVADWLQLVLLVGNL